LHGDGAQPAGTLPRFSGRGAAERQAIGTASARAKFEDQPEEIGALPVWRNQQYLELPKTYTDSTDKSVENTETAVETC